MSAVAVSSIEPYLSTLNGRGRMSAQGALFHRSGGMTAPAAAPSVVTTVVVLGGSPLGARSGADHAPGGRWVLAWPDEEPTWEDAEWQ